MNLICYLIIQGVKPKFGSERETRREAGTVRVTKNRPNTTASEIAVKLHLELPDALFFKPTLKAEIRVPESTGHSPVITADVADNIADIIREQTGLTVRISSAEFEVENNG